MSFGKHTQNSGFESGNHWVVCDRCGFDYREHDMMLEWDGSVVCRFDYEPQHFLNRIKVQAEEPMSGIINPESSDSFSDRSSVTANTVEDTVPTGNFTGGGL
jgi:hypothetical protein